MPLKVKIIDELDILFKELDIIARLKKSQKEIMFTRKMIHDNMLMNLEFFPEIMDVGIYE